MDQNIRRSSRCRYAWCFPSRNPNVNIQQLSTSIPVFRFLQSAQQRKIQPYRALQELVFGSSGDILSFTEIKALYFFCYQVHNCVNEEPQLIYHLICCLLFDCMLLPLEVFVVEVVLELNLNKLYGLWKFCCADHQLTDTTHYVQK